MSREVKGPRGWSASQVRTPAFARAGSWLLMAGLVVEGWHGKCRRRHGAFAGVEVANEFAMPVCIMSGRGRHR
jgi:hypothetical protein